MSERRARLPSGWKEVQLGKLARLSGRIGWKGLTAKEYTKEGPLFLSVHSLNYGDYVDYRDAFHISQQRYDESPEIMLRSNDVLICKDGAGIGKLGIVGDLPGEATINSSLLLVRSQQSILPKYLYYILSSPYFQDIVKSRLMGATTPHLYQRDIAEFPIYLPPRPEQVRIVNLLEEAFAGLAIATTIAEKNLKSARELFDNYLQSLRGEKTALGPLVEIRTGKLDSNAASKNGRYPFFTCSRDIFAIDIFAFDCDAVLLAGNNAVGDFNVKHYTGKFNAYQRTYVITTKDQRQANSRYIYFQILKNMKEFKEKSVGSGTKFLKLGMIKELQIVLPSLPDQKAVALKLDTLLEISQKLEDSYQRKLANIAELKQSILQKAFSGELNSSQSLSIKEAAE